MQWWFKKFCKGDESLEDEECSGQPWEVDNDELRGSLKLILLELLKKLLKNSTLTILQLFDIWRKLDRWKRSISWYLVSWIKILKNHCLEVSSSLILCKTIKSFLDQIVTCDDKWIPWDNWQQPLQKLEQEEGPKHFPKQTRTKKGSRSLFGGLLLVWSTTAFWILIKPLHLRNVLSK